MTQKVNPSFGRDVRNRELTAAIRNSGPSGEGFISESGNRIVEDSEGELPAGDLGTFTFNSSSGLTATIGPGEAIVGGAHLATDETFDVDLDASTNGQSVYIGWRDGQADTIVAGLESAFTADDNKIKVWEFDTDATSVTSDIDHRQLGSDAGIPAGGIIMWSGTTANVPDGWTLCDGSDPRPESSAVPDLRNRFVAAAGDEYSVGDTGGEKEHQLTVEELPSHKHDVFSGGSGSNPEDSGGNASTGETGATGGDQPHENRPRFYALAFIYRL